MWFNYSHVILFYIQFTSTNKIFTQIYFKHVILFYEIVGFFIVIF